MASCEIPYITNYVNATNKSAEEKTDYVNKHIAIVKSILAEPGLNFSQFSRSSIIDGKKVKYLTVDDKNKDAFNSFKQQSEFSENIGLREIEVAGAKRKVIVVDATGIVNPGDLTIGDIELEAAITDYQKELVRKNGTSQDYEIHKDLVSLTEDKDIRKQLYTIFESVKEKVEKLKEEIKGNTTSLHGQLDSILNNFKEENIENLYKAESAFFFLKHAVQITKNSRKNFTGFDNFNDQKKELDTLETFEERKEARGKLANKVNNIKNKYYIFSTLEKVITAMGINNTVINVFDTYNRFTIEKELKNQLRDQAELTPDLSIKIEESLAGFYSNKAELKLALNEVLKEVATPFDVNDIINNATFPNLKTTDLDSPSKSFTEQILESRDELEKLIRDTKNLMLDLNVDLLWDSYLKYNLGVENQEEFEAKKATMKTIDKFKLLTKDQIKQSILKVNGNTSWFGYQLGLSEQSNDPIIQLLGTLLKRTQAEADVDSFMATQGINERFKGIEKIDPLWNDQTLTYTFELSDNRNPQEYILNAAGDKLEYTYWEKNAQGVAEEKTGEFILPQENFAGRYYKLSEKSDDIWAYKSDNGRFYKVFATRAIKGLNSTHRIQTENSIRDREGNLLIDSFIESDDLQVEYNFNGKKRLLSKIDDQGEYKDVTRLKEILLREYRSSFNTEYKVDVVDRKDHVNKIIEIKEQLDNSKSEEEAKKIVSSNFYTGWFGDTKEQSKLAHFLNTKKEGVRSSDHYILYKDENTNEEKVLFNLHTSKKPVWLTWRINKTTNKIEYFNNGRVVDISEIDRVYKKGNGFTQFKPVDDVLIDPEFESLKTNPEYLKYYNEVVSTYTELQEDDQTGYLTQGKIGQIQTAGGRTWNDLKEDVINKGVLQTAKERFDDYVRIKPDTRDNKSIDGFDTTGFAPTYTVRVDDQNLVEKDLIINLLEMKRQNANYKALYALESNMKFLLLQNQGSAALGIEARKLEVDKNKGFKWAQEKLLKTAQESLKFTIKAFYYNEPKIQDSLLAGTKAEFVADKIRGLLFFQTLAVNVGSTFRNLTIGQVNNFLEASSKKHGLDNKLVVEALGELMGTESLDIMSGLIGHTNIADSHYITKLAYLTNAISGLTLDAKNFKEDKSKLDTYASYNALFMGQQATEAMNLLPLMIGYAKKFEIEKYTDIDGVEKSYTLYDAMRVGGKTLKEKPEPHGVLTLENRDGSTLDRSTISKFTINLQGILSEAQGDYGKFNNTMAKNTFIGKLALTFANWVYPSMKKRFDWEFRYDMNNQEQEYGGYQLTHLANSFGMVSEWKELLTYGPETSATDFIRDNTFPILKRVGQGIGRAALSLPLNIVSVPFNLMGVMPDYKGIENKQLKYALNIKDKLNLDGTDNVQFDKFYGLSRLEGETDIEWQERRDDAYDKYLTALQTASKEYAILTALIIMGVALKALDDEEEDPNLTQKILKNLDVQSRQLVSDMGLGTPLLSPFKSLDFVSQRARDPFNIIKTLELNLKLIGQIAGFQVNLDQGSLNFNINDRYDRSGPGYDKGEYKLQRSLERTAFAPFYQMSKLFEPEQQEKITKMLNKGAIFTDKDLEKANLQNEE